MRQEARARWGVGESQQLSGMRWCFACTTKGQEWVIRALADLRVEFPDCKLLLAGDGAYRPQLEALTEVLSLQDAVIFADFVRDIESVYRAIDVFVFPALFEGLGTSLLAAMAHGVPSVTYLGCALGEIVEDGKSGLQVEPRTRRRCRQRFRTILTTADSLLN